jgi:lipid A 3-O-deacylase
VTLSALINRLGRLAMICLILSCTLVVPAGNAAFADGMPFKAKKPEPASTPLDKALDEIQNKEPPVEVAKPAAAPEPAPVVAAPKEEPKPVVEEKPAPPPVPDARVVEVQENTSFFGLSVGMYDPFTHGRGAAALGLQFEPGVKIAGIIQPLFGAIVTTNGALYGYGGVGVPFNIAPHWRLMPSVAIGAYKRGGGVDLDRTVVYRAGAELAYIFDNKSRLGLNVHVLSNGTSMGRDDRTEVIGLAYTAPFELLSGPVKTAPAASTDKK